MTFLPPVSDLLTAMRAVGSHSAEDAEPILTEAGRLAADVIAPLNRAGDKIGATYANGTVTTVPGWREAYAKWCDGGWSSISGPAAYGGQELPMVLSIACAELWNSANLAFALSPLLTTGAIEAISVHGSDELKSTYLQKLIAGTWTGTMNLTEPQSGSDLSGLRTKAVRAGDGTYRISGTKIYITYGEHDCSENIIHLVLARLEDAPAGTRGISLFLVPKFMPDGTRNDLRCASIEHKLGIHGSPTCTMIYGDGGGATGWLIGEENRGLNCMFTMMNNARLMVGVQGVGVAERATQMAHAYARERKQGRAPGRTEGQSPIIEHPDVARMLMEMRAKTMAARLLCMATAAAMDDGNQSRAALLTPLAKSFATDVACEVASLNVQVHGGMGFIEDTGAAQLLRDSRILPIYEGTNGIQAIDLVVRKVQLDGGAALEALLKDCAASLDTSPTSHLLKTALAECARMATWLKTADAHDALTHATHFQRALASTVSASLLIHAASLEPNPDHAIQQRADANAFTRICVMADVVRISNVS